jgi:hypothetical protein
MGLSPDTLRNIPLIVPGEYPAGRANKPGGVSGRW